MSGESPVVAFRTLRLRFLVAAVLLLGLDLSFLVLPWGGWDSIVVHHTASQRDDADSIRRAHLARGWFETAYHLVLANGTTDVPRGHLQPTRRYLWGLWSVATRSPRANVSAVHVVVVGNYETDPVPEDLQSALGHAIAELQDRYGIPDDRVGLHRDVSPTACPGRFLDRGDLRAWSREAERIAPELRDQHRRVLERSPHRGALGGGLALFHLLLLFSGFSERRRRGAPGAAREDAVAVPAPAIGPTERPTPAGRAGHRSRAVPPGDVRW